MFLRERCLGGFVPKLVESRREVVDNVLNYQDAITNIGNHSAGEQTSLLNTLSLTQAWLVVTRKGVDCVAPLKWCGWKNMTASCYHRNRRTLPTASASVRIGELFTVDGEEGYIKLPAKHPAVATLHAIATTNGKRLRSERSFWFLRGEDLPDNELDQVDALASLIATSKLSKQALALLAERIAV